MGRILVIGATGLIGLPVAGRLLADGHQVRLLVRDTGRARPRSRPSPDRSAKVVSNRSVRCHAPESSVTHLGR
ncbi:MAG TPA: NmrA family NAD(P)-binding protein, partial [Streptosporangiaceae bacterium]|nr:NmrA family NAD(P)-binding protein [Streptosporangiaceae bacterium]